MNKLANEIIYEIIERCDAKAIYHLYKAVEPYNTQFKTMIFLHICKATRQLKQYVIKEPEGELIEPSAIVNGRNPMFDVIIGIIEHNIKYNTDYQLGPTLLDAEDVEANKENIWKLYRLCKGNKTNIYIKFNFYTLPLKEFVKAFVKHPRFELQRSKTGRYTFHTYRVENGEVVKVKLTTSEVRYLRLGEVYTINGFSYREAQNHLAKLNNETYTLYLPTDDETDNEEEDAFQYKDTSLRRHYIRRLLNSPTRTLPHNNVYN